MQKNCLCQSANIDTTGHLEGCPASDGHGNPIGFKVVSSIDLSHAEELEMKALAQVVQGLQKIVVAQQSRIERLENCLKSKFKDSIQIDSWALALF